MKNGPEPLWHIHPFPADEEEGICGLFTYIPTFAANNRTEPLKFPLQILEMHRSSILFAGQWDIAHFADAFEGIKDLLATRPFRRHNGRLLTADTDFKSHIPNMLASDHHQSGSCRMGSDCQTSVVDSTLKVHGFSNLFVADSSIFPDTIIPSENACPTSYASAPDDLDAIELCENASKGRQKNFRMAKI
jgi:choline dehydrogenase